MAGGEDQPKQLIADLIVQARVTPGLCGLVLALSLMVKVGKLALHGLVPADLVDQAVLGGGHQPAAGVGRDSVSRPLLQRRYQSVLGEVLRVGQVAGQPPEAGDQAAASIRQAASTAAGLPWRAAWGDAGLLWMGSLGGVVMGSEDDRSLPDER